MVQLDLPLWPQSCLHVCLQLFLAMETGDLADATVRDYHERSAWLERVFGGDTPLSEITYARLRRCIDEVGPRSQSGLMHVTIRKRFVLLRKVMKHAHQMGWIDVAPPALPRLPNDGERRRAYLSPEQFPRFRAALCPGPLQVAADLMFHGGLHTWDVEHMERQDLEPDYEWPEGYRGRWLRKNHKNEHRGVEPAWFPMRPEFRQTVMDWLPSVRNSSRALVTGHLWNLCRQFAFACGRAEVPRVSPIDLRRSCASNLLAQGHDDEYVRQYLGQIAPLGADGHARCRPTILHQHYAVVTPELLRRARTRAA